MSSDKNSGKYWPYMILGFLFIGITLGYWTVKSAISLPVQESNEYLGKYQYVEKKGREIQEAEARFDKKYNVSFTGLEKSDFKEKNIKRKPHQYYQLKNSNEVALLVTSKDGKVVDDINVTLLLTRPQTRADDKLFEHLPFENGKYVAKDINVSKKGRYILRFRLQKDDGVKFLDIYGVK